MSWQNTLKMVYDDSWRFTRMFPPSEENPYVFLDDAELPEEEWDYVSQKGGKGSYGRSWHVSVYAPPTKDRWVSNFGRVKEDDKIVEPEMTGYGYGVWFKGNKDDYKQNRWGSKKHGKKKRVSRSGKVLIKWNITVDWAKENNITIPDKAPVYDNELEEGDYGQWKRGELTPKPPPDKSYHKERWPRKEDEMETELYSPDLDAFLWGHVMHCIMHLEDEIDEDNMFDKVMECMRSKQQKGELKQDNFENVSSELLEEWAKSPYQAYWDWNRGQNMEKTLMDANAIQGWPQEVKDKLKQIGEEEEEEKRRKEEEENSKRIAEENKQKEKNLRIEEKERRATEGMGPGRRRGRKLGTTRGKPRGSDKKASVWFETIRGIQ